MTEEKQTLLRNLLCRDIPPGLEKLLAGVKISSADLQGASPSRLIDPFALDGLRRLLELLEADFRAGRMLNLQSGGTPDSPVAAAMLARIFRRQRKYIRRGEAATGSGTTPESTLEFDLRAGLRYRRGELIAELPPGQPGGGIYSPSGLVFKLGEGRRRMAEKGYGRRYVAFDLETTGTNPRRDEIIEIGAVRVADGRIGEEFSALVKPSRPLPPLISKLTGITEKDLESAPPLSQVLPGFLDFIGDSILIAHNIEFDFSFLSRAVRKLLARKLQNKTFCTLRAARAKLPGQSHRLGAVAEALGIELKDWHRATADARAAGRIFLHFSEAENASGRYDYFRQAVGPAGLGVLLSRIPISGDSAIFLRHGFQAVRTDYLAGERYFRRRAGRVPGNDTRLAADLNSWRRKKRGRAVYRLIGQALASLPADESD